MGNEEISKRKVAILCASILMRLGKNDFKAVSMLIDRLRAQFDEWMRERPEKDELARRKAQKL